MKQRILTVSMLFILLATIAACGSDDGSSVSVTETTPAGPISYTLVESRLRAEAAEEDASVSDANLSLAASSTATTVLTKAASGIITHFVPEAAPVIGVISAVTSLISGNKTAEQITQLTEDVYTEEQQIRAIQTNLALTNNLVYQHYVDNQAEQAEDWAYNYYQLIENFMNFNTGNATYYDEFISSLGLKDGSWPTGTTYATIAADSSIMSNLTGSVTNQTNFFNQLSQLATAGITNGNLCGGTQCTGKVPATSSNKTPPRMRSMLYEP